MKKLVMNALALLPLLLAPRRKRVAEHDLRHMATSTEPGFTTIAGTLLRRALLACLAPIALAACGGAGDEIVVTRSSNSGWIAIDWTSAPSGSTGEEYLILEGTAFLEADTVFWQNTATGESLEALHNIGCDIGYFTVCGRPWRAEIPLAVGVNVIRVTASDSAGNGETEAITITRLPDTAPPTVLSVSPSGTAVSIFGNVKVTFSEDVDASTITAETVQLQDTFGNRVPAAVSLLSLSLVRLAPFGTLTPNTIYHAVVTTGVRDRAGNALAVSYAWSFRTGAN